MDKILSVIIPTYNMEAYLRKCLDSLIVDDELMKLLEVLVINDGSTDNSSTIAHDYEKEYPETFRVIDKENGHYGSCVNRGLKEASGKYVKILDADDSFENVVFNDYLKSIVEVDTDLILNDFLIVDTTYKVKKKYKFSFCKDRSEYLFSEIEKYLECSNIQMYALAYKRCLLNNMKYKQMEGILYTDQQWNSIPLGYVKSVFYFNGGLYRYVLGRPGQSVEPSIRKKRIEDHLRCVEDMILQYSSNTPLINDNFVRNRIKIMIKYAYLFFLITNPSENNGAIIAFDKTVQSLSPKIYSEIDTIRLVPFLPVYFIKKWKEKKQSKISLYYKYLLLINSPIKKLLKIVGYRVKNV